MGTIAELVVKVRAENSDFNGGMDDVSKRARRTKGDVESSLNGIDLSEGRGTVNLLGEDLGITLPRHVQSFLGTLPGVGVALAAAFAPVAIITAGLAIAEFIEKIREHNEALEQARQKTVDLVGSVQEHTDALAVQNDQLQAQIDKFNGRVSNNLALALDQAKVKADGLLHSLTDDLTKAQALMNTDFKQTKVEAIFGPGDETDDVKAAYTQAANHVRDVEHQGREALNNLKLDGLSAAQAQQQLLDAQLNGNKNNIAALHQAYLDMKAAYDSAVAGTEGDDTRNKKAIEGARAMMLTFQALEDQAKEAGRNIALSLQKGNEDANPNDSVEKRVAQQIQVMKLQADGLEAQAKVAANYQRMDVFSMGDKPTPEQDVAIQTELQNRVYQIQHDGLERQLELYKKYPAMFRDQIASTNAEIERLEQQHSEQLSNIGLQQAQREQQQQANDLQALQDFYNKTELEREKDLVKQSQVDNAKLKGEEESIKATTAIKLQAIQDQVSRGLLTRQEEAAALKQIYDTEITDLIENANKQVGIEEALQKSLKAMGKGPGTDGQYEASLKRETDLQNGLNASILQYGKDVDQVTNKTRSQYLSLGEYIKKLDVDNKNLTEHMRHYWQDALSQMNAGVTSGFNQMLETGRGFGQAMVQTFDKILEGFADMMLQMLLQQIEKEILMLAFHQQSATAKAAIDSTSNKKSVESDAAAAAAKAYKAMADIPVVGPALGAAAAAATFAAVMAFSGMTGMATGGKVPFDNFPALLHQGEVVVPRTFVQEFPQFQQGSAKAGRAPRTGTAGGHTFNIHLHDVTDGQGIERMVQKQVIPLIRRELSWGRA